MQALQAKEQAEQTFRVSMAFTENEAMGRSAQINVSKKAQPRNRKHLLTVVRLCKRLGLLNDVNQKEMTNSRVCIKG